MSDDSERIAQNAQDLPSGAKENLALLTKIEQRQTDSLSGMQLKIERLSAFFGTPVYFIGALAFMVAWLAINTYGTSAGWAHVDRPPFAWLQGIVTLNALFLTVAVLVRQNRMAQIAEHRSHLDLQINLLTEQKVTAILKLVDQLHRPLAGEGSSPVKDVEEMTKPADADAILHVIKQT